MDNYKFSMGQKVSLVKSGEAGEVIARAEYAHSENSYLIRYVTADKRQIESWWGVSALKAS